MLLKEKIIDAVVSSYDSLRSAMRADGSVLDQDGYSTYSQYAGYYFAFLYSYENRDNPCYRQEEALKLAIAGWNHYATLVGPDGRTKVYTRNQDWGYALEEWGFFYWMSSYALLKDVLDSDVAEKWRDGLRRIFGQAEKHVKEQDASKHLAETLARHQVRNHFVWTVLAVFRYGQIFADQSAMDTARKVMHRIVDAQHPVGSWMEAGGLVLNYAGVTICPISLFSLYDHDEKAKRAVEKSLDYFLSLKYPDMTNALGIDVRNRYSDSIGVQTAIGYCETSRGAAYLEQWIDALAERGTLRGNTHNMACVCEMLRMFPEHAALPERRVVQPLDTRYEDLCLFVREKGRFTVSFCGMEHKAYNNRWMLERQSLLGVYISGEGAFCGGAHSIGQHEFSLFNIMHEGKVHYMHDACRLLETGAVLDYAGHACTVEVTEWEEETLTIRFSIDSLGEAGHAYVNMPFYDIGKKSLRIGGEEITPGEVYWRRDISPGEETAIGGVRFSISRPGTFEYPVFPFNSYRQVQIRDYSEAFGILRIPLCEGNTEVEWTIHC